MSIELDKITPEEMEIINEFKQASIDNFTKQYSDDFIRLWAGKMYEHVKSDHRCVIIVDNPSQMLAVAAYWLEQYKDGEPEVFDQDEMQRVTDGLTAEQLKEYRELYRSGDVKGSARSGSVSSQLSHSVGQWWRVWAGWYHGAVEAYRKYKSENLKFDTSNLELFTNFNEGCSTWVACEKVIFVSRNPIRLEVDADEPHSEDGPAIEYVGSVPEWNKYWFIEGNEVTEQIVMAPETLTIDQINDERNEETKRIMLNRFGWDRFMLQTGATTLDTVTHEWMESLCRLDSGQVVLFTVDPSTGRPYALEVDESCKTCEEAQKFMASYENAHDGSPAVEFSYPIGRS